MLTLLILTCLGAIGCSMLCSLWEATLLSLNPVRLESLQRQGHRYADTWLNLKKDIDRPISAILIVNTISNTGGATLAGSLFAALYGGVWLGVFLIGLTLGILYISEIGPKVIGATYAEKLAPYLGRPLEFATWALTPLVALTQAFSSRLVRKDSSGPDCSAVDIEVLAQRARAGNVIADEQERIIINASKMGEKTVGDILIPRDWIVFFKLHQSAGANLKLGQHTMHTRYPVSDDGSADNIRGYINYKDLIGFRQQGDALDLRMFLRPILSFRPDTNLNTAMKQLISKRHHMAVVRDADGKVLGLVTLEDVIEELTGEIEDEFDDSNTQTIIPINRRLWRVGAAVTIREADVKTGLMLGIKGDPDRRIGDWLEQKLAGNLRPGLSYESGGVRYTIQQARRGRIYQIMLEPAKKPEKSRSTYLKKTAKIEVTMMR